MSHCQGGQESGSPVFEEGKKGGKNFIVDLWCSNKRRKSNNVSVIGNPKKYGGKKVGQGRTRRKKSGREIGEDGKGNDFDEDKRMEKGSTVRI